MTNETQSITESPSTAFGARLQTAREALGMGTKDAAARLRLNEKVILMMEKEHYAVDLPITFIRGYIRSYGKLLQIPDHEIKKALEPITAKPTSTETSKPAQPVTSNNYSMQISTYFIALTMLGLVGTWWYSHSGNKDSTTTVITEAQLLHVPSDTIQSTVRPLALSTPLSPQDPTPQDPTLQNPTMGTTRQTTVIKTQPDGQTNITVNKPAVATPGDTSNNKTVAPVDEDGEQYTDDANTD